MANFQADQSIDMSELGFYKIDPSEISKLPWYYSVNLTNSSIDYYQHWNYSDIDWIEVVDIHDIYSGQFSYVYDANSKLVDINGYVTSINFTDVHNFVGGWQASWSIDDINIDVSEFESNQDILALIFAGEDTIQGSAENDKLYGYGGDDVIYGNGGIDVLDGGSGADVMVGGSGHSIYYVDNSQDVVVEFAGGGTDSVYSEIDYTLGSAVDRLFLSGLAISGAGNDLSNWIYGNDRSNILDGHGGNDDLHGRLGNDKLDGGSGNDKLYGEAGNDTLYGGSGIDTISGGEGNDNLYGDAGADYLSGGTGTDRAVYATAGSGIVVSLANASINTGDAKGDTYNSIENLTGSKFNDSINGNDAANAIDAAGGNDRIKGYAGNDTLTGGTGKDTFIVNTALSATSNVDRITDFSTADDIWLDNSIFTALSAAGVLSTAAFRTNDTGLAADSSDRIIYEKDTGELYYDANGTGSGGGILFAKIGVGLSLTHADFLVI